MTSTPDGVSQATKPQFDAQILLLSSMALKAMCDWRKIGLAVDPFTRLQAVSTKADLS